MSLKYSVVVVGEGGVGKSAITLQLVHNKFVESYDPTVEDSYRKQMNVDKKTCMLDILDTAGQEMYSAYQDQYYKSGQGFVVVYSVTDANTFKRVQSYRDRICRAKDSESVPMMLLGNKIDLVDQREVQTKQGEELARLFDCPFFETSAKERINIDESFTELVRTIKKKKKEEGKGETKEKEKKRGCNVL